MFIRFKVMARQRRRPILADRPTLSWGIEEPPTADDPYASPIAERWPLQSRHRRAGGASAQRILEDGRLGSSRGVPGVAGRRRRSHRDVVGIYPVGASGRN